MVSTHVITVYHILGDFVITKAHAGVRRRAVRRVGLSDVPVHSMFAASVAGEGRSLMGVD
jgi:hypothetical protein